MKNTTPKTIVSKDDSLAWNVINVQSKWEEKRKVNRSYFTVTCSKCSYQITATKGNIQARKSCPGCAKKPAAVKTDPNGNCISICEVGMVEFIRDYQEKHSVSERKADRQFIDTAKAHLAPDDPIAEKLTEESVGAKVRRLTGKKKDTSKDCGGPPHKKWKELDPVDMEDMDSSARAIALVNKYTPKEYFEAEDFIRKAIIILEGIYTPADDPKKSIWAIRYIVDYCINELNDPNLLDYYWRTDPGSYPDSWRA